MNSFVQFLKSIPEAHYQTALLSSVVSLKGALPAVSKVFIDHYFDLKDLTGE